VRRHPSHNERPGALANRVSKGEDDVHRSKEASQRCVSVKAMRPMLSHGACEADGGYALSPWPPSPPQLKPWESLPGGQETAAA
jgi:hypothetical protein